MKTIQEIQVELITKGYDINMVFDPIVEGIIGNLIKSKAAIGTAKAAETEATKKAAWLAAKKAQAAKNAVKSEVYINPMMKSKVPPKATPDIWSANKGAGLHESIKLLVTKLK